MLKTLSLLLALSIPSALALHALAPESSPVVHQVSAASDLTLTPRHRAAAQITHELLSNGHYAYAAKPATAEVGDEVFDSFLNMLDPQRVFLTQAHVQQMEAFRPAMTDAIQGRDLEPAMGMYKVWQDSALERIAFAKSLLDEGFDFTVDESWVARDKDTPFVQDQAQFDDLWRKYVKSDWLRLRLAGQDDAAIRQTLAKRYDRMKVSFDSSSADQVVSAFLNAYGSVLDPHTNYMAPIDAESFNMSMSLSLEGIGAVLQLQDDVVVVRSLMAGGPAAKSGQLNTGDRILAVGQGKDGPMVDVVGWRLDEVVGLIRGKRGSVVRLSVAASADSAVPRLVQMSRDKVMMEEQEARKDVVDMGGQRVGVITLPGFYLDFQARAAGQANAKSASNDVARLLEELKKENVSGVLVDLRGNGGGSLSEAVELTGLFIDVGPVVQVRDAAGKVAVEGDTDPGVAWSGPMAVLVDGNSASASEIFAAAIQDHGRGLVLGESTFGKGTVQSVIDLDQAVSAPGARFGQVKLTIAQFFRISGSSTQRDGVKPDVAFVQTLGGDEAGEASLDNALPPSSVAPAKHTQDARLQALLPRLRQKHSARMGSDPQLKWWVEDVEMFRSERDRKHVSLNEQARREERERQLARQKARDDARRELGLFVPTRRADDGLAFTERSIADQVRDEEEAKALAKDDPLLKEAVRILADAVSLGARVLALK